MRRESANLYKRLGLEVPNELAKKIEQEAKDKGVSRNKMLNIILNRYYSNNK